MSTHFEEPKNIIEIEAEITERLKTIKSPEDLRELQQWAKKAKRQKVVKPTATSFKQVYYSYERPVYSQGSGKFLCRKTQIVSYTSFVFLGLEIFLPEAKYVFDEKHYDKKAIWIDSKIKWGGTEYFPKEPTTEINGFDLEAMFFEHLKAKKYFVFVKNKNTAYLLNEERFVRKLICGKRISKHYPVVKITKDHLQYLNLPEWKPECDLNLPHPFFEL